MNQYIENKLKKLNFNHITPIQKAIFADFHKPVNLIGISPTGTGKTHAYLLPILSQIDSNKNQIQAIIVVPTNELIFQILKMLKEIKTDNITIQIFYGGMDQQKTNLKLEKKQPQIIISTPQKLFTYTENKKLKIKNTKFVVLDEADMLFDEKFLSFLNPLILANWKPKILLFSATFPENIKKIVKKNFGQTNIIDLQKPNLPNIKYFLLKSNNKLNTLIELTKSLNPFLSLIFISHKKDQSQIFQHLKEQNINVLNFSSDLPVKKRKQYIKEINKLKYQYIITSDLAARGLDLDVSLVINYDLPNHIEFFQHRCGRTGRMGKEGETITIYDQKDVEKIIKLKKQQFNFQSIILSKNKIQIIDKTPKKKLNNYKKNFKKNKKND